MSRTFVFAHNVRKAEDVCYELGISAPNRHTIIVTGGNADDALQGVRFQVGDRVAFGPRWGYEVSRPFPGYALEVMRHMLVRDSLTTDRDGYVVKV